MRARVARLVAAGNVVCAARTRRCGHIWTAAWPGVSACRHRGARRVGERRGVKPAKQVVVCAASVVTAPPPARGAAGSGHANQSGLARRPRIRPGSVRQRMKSSPGFHVFIPPTALSIVHTVRSRANPRLSRTKRPPPGRCRNRCDPRASSPHPHQADQTANAGAGYRRHHRTGAPKATGL